MDSERKIRLLGKEIDPKPVIVFGLATSLFGHYALRNPFVCVGGIVLIFGANFFATEKQKK